MSELGLPAPELPAPDLPARSRGTIALLEETCTSCMLCARECPCWCIVIDSHQEPVPGRQGGRPTVTHVLDRFAIDFSLCMYCGICIEVCPFDALFWSPELVPPTADLAGLTAEREQLREWMWRVPPPLPLDPGAEPAKETRAAEERKSGL